MTRTKNDAPPVRVKKKDANRTFLLEQDDYHLIMRTGKQVLDSCNLGISLEVWYDEITSMCDEVCCWVEKQKEKVRSCYLAPRGSKLVLFFCPSTESFDFALASELADLHSRLGMQYNVGTVEVSQVPWLEAERFFDPDRSRLVYGEQIKTPDTMEA